MLKRKKAINAIHVQKVGQDTYTILGIISLSHSSEVTTHFHGMKDNCTGNVNPVTERGKECMTLTECILLEITENQSSLNLRNVDGESIKLLIGKL